MTGFLYIVRCNEFYKIGIANNVRKRMSGMQTNNPYTLEVVMSIQGPRDAISRFEKRLHQTLKSWNVRGEWFTLTGAELKVLTEQCAAFDEYYSSCQLTVMTDMTKCAGATPGKVSETWEAPDLLTNEKP